MTTNMQRGQLHEGSFYGALETADLPDDIFRAIAACQSWLRDLQRTVHPGTAEVSVQLVVPIVAHFRGGPVESLTTNLRLVVTADGISAPDQSEPLDRVVTFLERLANAGYMGEVARIAAGAPRRDD